MILTHDGTLGKSQKHATKKGDIMMNGIMWDQTISKANKHHIYNTIIKSVMTFVREVGQMEQSRSIFLATEMVFWRRFACIPRRDRLRNERIREIMETKHTIIDNQITNMVWPRTENA